MELAKHRAVVDDALMVDLSTMNCATEFGVPDGAQLHGLATLDNSQFPEYVLIGVSDTVSAKKSATMIAANRV